MNDEQARRLLAHIHASDSRWFRVASRLLDFGLRGVPDTRESRNPVKWTAARIGSWMDNRQVQRVNRDFDRRTRGYW